MAPSLKERYDQRQLQQLQERARTADAQLLAEQKTAQLLLEAMNDQDLQKVSAIVDKLNTLKSPELPSLTAAIEQAQAELNKFTGGGPIAAAWSKLKSKVGIDNPVVKITTFADALERGFSQIPTILKNNGVDLGKADLSKSLATTLQTAAPTGAKSDKDMGKSPITGKDVPGKGEEKLAGTPKPPTGSGEANPFNKGDSGADLSSLPGAQSGTKPGIAPTPARKPPPQQKTGGQDQPPKPPPPAGKKPLPAKKSSSADEGHDLAEADPIGWAKDKLGVGKPPKGVSGEEKLKNITAQLQKALAPGGIFGAFKKVPYIDSTALAQELVQAPIKVFSNIAQRVQKGAKAAELAPDLKDQIQGQGDQQTKGANTANPSQQSAQSQPSQPGKPTTATADTTGTGEAPKAGPGQARGGGAEVQDDRGQGNTPEKAQQFRAGLAKIYKGAGVDPDMGQKLMKYLIGNKLMDRTSVEGHGDEATKPAAA